MFQIIFFNFRSAGNGFENCSDILDNFAAASSNLTFCSIKNARPVRLCENCIEHYVKFHITYSQLQNTIVNGTSCRSIFISHDRFEVVLTYHNNILSMWDKGNCNGMLQDFK